MENVAIIHFQPIEKYPPITNLLDYLAEINYRKKVFVYTSNCPNGFKKYVAKNNQIVIKRVINVNSSQTAIRLMSYVFFYTAVFLRLIFSNPKAILYYETLSVLPVFWYKKIKPFCKVFIHYHEYTSLEEYQKNSLIVKWLHKKEQELYRKTFWISHTNNHRLEMFLNDEKLHYNKSKHHIMPNYPPKNWISNSIIDNTINDTVRFIYIGSLGLDTMYLKEIAQFIISQNGKALLDIYTNQFNNDAISYIENLNTDYIKILGSVEYENIPQVIKQGNYNIGLIIYNGHIKNYIFNAPNKLFEYLACGLHVWYPSIMVGCKPYENTNTTPFIFEVDFKNIEGGFQEFFSLTDKKILNTTSKFYYQAVYNNITTLL